MRIISKILKVIFLVIFVFQHDSVLFGEAGTVSMFNNASIDPINADIVIDNERKRIEQVTIETEKIKSIAKLMINETNEKRAKHEISGLEAAKIIGEQNYKIERADERLAALIKESIENVEDAEAQAESYMKQLIGGAQNVGARLLAPFKSGYGYTQEEKGIAQAIIKELDKQLEILGKKYEEKIKSVKNDAEKLRLVTEYNEIKQSFIQELHEQQLITGQQMSANRKLFWGAVATAGMLVGSVLAKQYLGAEISLPNEMSPETPNEMPTEYQALSKNREFGMSPEERDLMAVHPEAFGQTQELFQRVQKAAEGIPAPGSLADQAQSADFGFPREDQDVSVHGAPKGESLMEKEREFTAESQPSASALERKKQRETFAERAAQEKIDREEQLKKSKRTEEEQQKEAAELGEYLSTGARSIFGSSQYRSPEEEPVMFTDVEKERSEKEREQAVSKAQQARVSLEEIAEKVQVGGIEGAQAVKSTLQNIGPAAYQAAESMGNAITDVVGEENMESTVRFGGQIAEKQLEDADLGRTHTYEQISKPGESFSEKGIKELSPYVEMARPYVEPFVPGPVQSGTQKTISTPKATIDTQKAVKDTKPNDSSEDV